MFKWPVIRDPEPGVKLGFLNRRQAEKARAAPLVLAIGSSRMAMDFRPELLDVSRRRSKKQPLVFNFGLTQMLPIRQLIGLRSLLAEGVQPKWVLLEYCPDLLEHAMDHHYNIFDIQRASPDDMAVMGQIEPIPVNASTEWWRGQFFPTYYHRRIFLNYMAPDLVEPDHRNYWHWKGITDYGWLRMPYCASPTLRKTILSDLKQNEQGLQKSREWKVNPFSEKPFTQMLDLCRDRNIKVTLVMLPDYGPSWGRFTVESMQRQDDYLCQISREYSIPVIDGRDWVDDHCMADHAHATHEGATLFTEMLGREYLNEALKAEFTPEEQKSPYTPPAVGRLNGERPSLSWGEGFSDREGSDKHIWRWAEPEGRLYVRCRKARKVELKFFVSTGHHEPAYLEVHSDLFPVKRTLVGADAVEWTQTFDVPAGQHTITLRCDARRVDAPSDPRVMIFRVANPVLNYVD